MTELKAICIHKVAQALHSVINLKSLIIEKHIPKAFLGTFGVSLFFFGKFLRYFMSALFSFCHIIFFWYTLALSGFSFGFFSAY